MEAGRLYREFLPGTTGGAMAPLWSMLDRELVTYTYLLRCEAGETKGAYVHIKRTCRLFLLSGRAEVFWREYRERERQRFQRVLLCQNPDRVEGILLPNETEFTIYTPEASFVLNMCDYPWISSEQGERLVLPLED